MSLASFKGELTGLHRIAIETSVIIAASETSDPRQPCARWLLNEIEHGSFPFAAISALTVAEVLVRPVSASLQLGVIAQTRLREFPNLSTAPLDFDTAVEVAHVRATTKLKMPDAIVLGTAIAHQVEAIVHGDSEWGKRVRPYAGAITLIDINRHCR